MVLKKIFKWPHPNFFLPLLNDLPLGGDMALHLNKLESPPQWWSVPSLVEIGPVILEKKILKYFLCIFTLCYCLPLEKGAALHLFKLESPHPKDDLFQVWLKLVKWFWRRILNIFCVFLPICCYLPLEKGKALHLNKIESPPPMMICARSGWNWPNGSGEEYENVKSLRQWRQTNFDQKSSLEPLAQVS
jgi:hypothetical protein